MRSDTNLKLTCYLARSPLPVAALPSMSLIPQLHSPAFAQGFSAAGECRLNDPTTDSSLMRFVTIRVIGVFGAIVACAIGCRFSILAADPEAIRTQADFSAFWKKFRSAVIAGDKAAAAEMTKFPLSMPYEVKAVKNKENFLRRYDEIFKNEANAAQCFRSIEPQKESDRRYEIYCPFKETPDDKENAPIRFIFELPKAAGDLSVSTMLMNDAA